MIKGVFLGIFIAVFIVSLVLTIEGLSGNLDENIFTGAVIGSQGIVNYSTLFMFISLLAIMILAAGMRINSGKLEKTAQEQAQETQEQILRLARARNLSDASAADAIALNLHNLHNNHYFPDVFDYIDPDQAHSEIKLMDAASKKRLKEGVDLYEKKYLPKYK